MTFPGSARVFARPSNLLTIVERDLNDAGSCGISSDWQFGIAYNAALKLSTLPANTGFWL